MPGLGSTVHRCPLASAAGASDSYSLGYSTLAHAARPGVGAVPADPAQLWHGSRARSRYPPVVSRPPRPNSTGGRTTWRAEGVPLKPWRKLSQPSVP